MKPPIRLLVRWRALAELKSHVDLLGWLAEEMPAEILILSDSPIPWAARFSSLQVESVEESLRVHPATRVLRGWKRVAETFDPGFCSCFR